MGATKKHEAQKLVGKKVKWETRSRGNPRMKAGRVLAVIPAGKSATKFLPKGTVRYKLRASEKAQFDRLLVYDDVSDRFNAPRSLVESFKIG